MERIKKQQSLREQRKQKPNSGGPTSTTYTNVAVPQRYQQISEASSSSDSSGNRGSDSHLARTIRITQGSSGNSSTKEMSASFTHKVAYWTKKMGISSSSSGSSGGGLPHHQQGQQHSGGGLQNLQGQGQHMQNAPPYPTKHHQRQQYGGGKGHYRGASSSSGHRSRKMSKQQGAIGEAMDESDDLYQSATQGIQRMNVDSRDETEATASTAAATQSYSIDDGSTIVSNENGNEMVMPPRTIGVSSSSRDRGGARTHPNPYNAHSFKAGNHTFTVDTKYSLIRVIGSGAYGVVISTVDASTSNKVAIKMVPRAFHDEVDAKRILREIKLLKHFHHENIIGVVDMMPPLTNHVEDFNDVYIVSDLMETDLHRIIYSKQPLTIDHVQYFLYQILRALKYIHSANVLHRDLKPSNLLVNSNCDLKVCDFGLARGVLSDEEMEGREDSNMLLTEYVVTRWYRAPEIMLACHEYAKPVDVWSVGCIFAELLGRKPYFPGEDYIDQVGF